MNQQRGSECDWSPECDLIIHWRPLITSPHNHSAQLIIILKKKTSLRSASWWLLFTLQPQLAANAGLLNHLLSSPSDITWSRNTSGNLIHVLLFMPVCSVIPWWSMPRKCRQPTELAISGATCLAWIGKDYCISHWYHSENSLAQAWD